VPSVAELENRLRGRGSDTEDSISRRLFKVNFEMSFQNQFDVVLLNENLDETLQKAEVLVREFLNR
jgi:guanylate kinase